MIHLAKKKRLFVKSEQIEHGEQEAPLRHGGGFSGRH
jgi:hypothetical protein